MLLPLVTVTSRAHAEEPDASLQKEVEELRRQVQDLQEQVKSLQKDTVPSPSPQTQPAPNAAPAKPSTDSIVVLRESWRQVTKGQTQAEIDGLLGAPTKEIRIDGKLVWYYYYAGIGGASVFFNGDGRVSSSQRPSIGWW